MVVLMPMFVSVLMFMLMPVAMLAGLFMVMMFFVYHDNSYNLPQRYPVPHATELQKSRIIIKLQHSKMDNHA